VQATDLTTYPDVTVVCGRSERSPKDRLAVTNPRLLADVTSASTEDYDRGEKLRNFQTLESVQEILILSHREARVSIHRRAQSGEWSVEEARAGDTFALASLGTTVEVAALYAAGLEDS
jgi:Uma2 family endonuclease